MDKKGEGVAGSVLGGGSFLQRGVLVQERRLLLLKGEEDFRGSRSKDQEERCLVGNFSECGGDGVTGRQDAWRSLFCS